MPSINARANPGLCERISCPTTIDWLCVCPRAYPSSLDCKKRAVAWPIRQAASQLGSGDQVEISHVARFLSKTSELPDVRSEKVASIQAALNQGAYDVEGRLDDALDSLLEDYLQ